MRSKYADNWLFERGGLGRGGGCLQGYYRGSIGPDQPERSKDDRERAQLAASRPTMEYMYGIC
jgi:hypothetical protein